MRGLSWRVLGNNSAPSSRAAVSPYPSIEPASQRPLRAFCAAPVSNVRSRKATVAVT